MSQGIFLFGGGMVANPHTELRSFSENQQQVNGKTSQRETKLCPQERYRRQLVEIVPCS